MYETAGVDEVGENEEDAAEGACPWSFSPTPRLRSRTET
jgi:hypothetical protein